MRHMDEPYVAGELNSGQQEGKGLALSPRFLRFLSVMEHLCDDSPMSHRKCETEASLSAAVVEIAPVARLVNEPRFTCTRTLPDFSNVETGTLLWLLHGGNMPSSKTSICKHPFKLAVSMVMTIAIFTVIVRSFCHTSHM